MLNELIAKLKVDGHTIGEQAAHGNDKAKRVMDMYKLVYVRQENGSIALLQAAYDDWRKDNA